MPTTMPLLLLHHAGGTAAVFRPLLRALEGECDVFPLELPGHGREWRRDPRARIDEAVQCLLEAGPDLDGQFGIFGHSLGAYLGLALAAHLERVGGSRCAVFFASANSAPSRAVRLPFENSPLHASDEEIFEFTRASGGRAVDELATNEQLHKRSIGLLRADYAILSDFLDKRRRTVVEADIVACYGKEDIFTDAQMDAWSWHTTGDFESHRFPGGHFYLDHEAESLAKIVVEHLRSPKQ